jgi:hypothetical protein
LGDFDFLGPVTVLLFLVPNFRAILCFRLIP